LKAGFFDLINSDQLNLGNDSV